MRIKHLLSVGLMVLSIAASTPLLYPQVTSAHTSVPSTITQNNWQLSWIQTPENGIGLSNVKYKGANSVYDLVFTSVIISNIYVDYSSGDIIDQLFPSDMKHFHKVDLTSGPAGFRLEAVYYVSCTEQGWESGTNRVGCYKYVQEWWFYSDGTFKPWLRIYGPGLIGQPGYGTNPTYEVRWRFNTGIFESADDSHEYYKCTLSPTCSFDWIHTQNENKRDGVAPFDANGYKFRVFDFPKSGEGLFVAPHPPDNARWWALRQHLGEEQITQGTCGDCDSFALQQRGSPELWRNGERLADSSIGPGYDNAHWYLSAWQWGTMGCNTSTNPCYPGGTWKAVGFP